MSVLVSVGSIFRILFMVVVIFAVVVIVVVIVVDIVVVVVVDFVLERVWNIDSSHICVGVYLI